MGLFLQKHNNAQGPSLPRMISLHEPCAGLWHRGYTGGLCQGREGALVLREQHFQSVCSRWGLWMLGMRAERASSFPPARGGEHPAPLTCTDIIDSTQ